MKKLICLAIALILISAAAFAEDVTIIDISAIEAAPVATIEPEETPVPASPAQQAEEAGVKVEFEDGFALTFPDGWMQYEVSDEAAESGVFYCLSDADAAHWLYIQKWNTDCADVSALDALIRRAAKPQSSTVHAFNDTDFIVYDLAEGDVSCCATLVDGAVLNFVFTPQSDAEYMATAVQIIGTFTVL